MQAKISEIKMLEQLEKFALKDNEMAELLEQYRSENGEIINKDLDENN